jgi:hypothetical protein
MRGNELLCCLEISPRSLPLTEISMIATELAVDLEFQMPEMRRGGCEVWAVNNID